MIKKLASIIFSVMFLFSSAMPVHAEGYSFFDREEEPLPQEETAVKVQEEKTLLYQDIPVLSFRVSNLSPQVESELDYTDWWYSEWDDCRYLFLPSTADRSKLVLDFTSGGNLYLNNIYVSKGMSPILATADEFDIKVGDIYCGKLKILQSELGCIYLAPEGKSLEDLDKNRNVELTGSTLMVDAKGKTVYSGEIEKLTSHGNSSWDYSKKKPYNLKLPTKADLFGLGKAKKWALLSNYLDHSMMRNVFTNEMSRAAGAEYVMDSVFVDLYADGSYRGTYQLCERVQIQKQRVNITDLEEKTEKINTQELDQYQRIAVGADGVYDCKVNSYKYYDIPNDPEDITGGYLLQFQQFNRYGRKADSGFVTKRGHPIQIDGPECASKAQVEYIRDFVQELEDAVYSETGYNEKGKHYSDYMDVDSFIRAYLADEISMNIDAGTSSFYMWKDSDLTGDGKLHFSPVWDFDLAYGTFSTSRKNSDGDAAHSFDVNKLFAICFTINGYDEKNTPESGYPTIGVNMVGRMYKHEEVAKRAADIYFSDFLPYLEEMVDNGGLIKMASKIKKSAEMNNMRWHTYGGREYCVFGSSSGADFLESVDIMRDFAQRRKNGLVNIWQDMRTVFIYGDASGDGVLDAQDASMLMQYVLDENYVLPVSQKTEDWLKYCDVSSDGVIAADDVALVIQKVLKEELVFPAEE